jgi:hypothetical protein
MDADDWLKTVEK